MLTSERHEYIIKLLEDNRAITVTELVQLLDASESTIRRDLNFLHQNRRLNKVHGGAISIEKNFNTKEEINLVKKGLKIEEKRKLAKYAAELITEKDFVYIDAGTTTEIMIDYIKNSSATFITNGIGHAKKLIQNNCKVYILGGELKITTEAIIGAEAINGLKKYNFTKGFFGVNGVHEEKGFTTPDIREALVKEEAIKRCNEAFVLCDESKLNIISSVTFAEIEKATIIMSKKEENNYDKYTKVMEVYI